MQLIEQPNAEHTVMKVLNILPIMPRAAGTSVFCGEVSNVLSGLGHDIAIGVFDAGAKDSLYPVAPGVRLLSIRDILSSNEQYDIVHIHGIWIPVLHRVAMWTRSNSIPLVWSPHGMLTQWAVHHKWFKKFVGWWLYQRWDLANADLLHVTAQSEFDDVRRMGLMNNVVIAPLGVKITQVQCHWRVERKTLLFVSRVQKKKGLVNLIKAWSVLRSEKENWRVRIVGPDEDNHTAELKKLCLELHVDNEFEFVGPMFGDELAREYASADLFVLPTHSENFGSVVIEALSQGVPVICTKGAPWRELETRKCGWWIDIGVEPLAHALREAMSLDGVTLHEMGARGRRLVEERYTWPSVANIIEKAYTQLIDRQDRGK